ncbi:MAG: hypothetical protein K9G67_00860 [Bacteroidales bacterium]|nr:hypothetical protein [Bacteroidales bacterium]MCF8374882.1 hypothetical protein [Bacteroidales bacterium]
MILHYKTEKLPPNFVILGVLLMALGIWRMILTDWPGILFFLIGLLLFFIRSGVTIDTGEKLLKQYTGLPGITKGKWENISSLEGLKITASRETRKMNVLSIGRTTTQTVYKLFMVFPGREVEIMSGESDAILKRAEEIASSLKIPLVNDDIR